MTTQTTTEAQPRQTQAENAWLTPRVDINELKDEYVLEAEMPGVSKESLEVLLDNNELTLLGRRADREPAGEPLHLESNRLGFRRTFELDPLIDTNRISVRIEQGLVTVRLPKSEKAKPRRVEVN
jgi:HSP20 family protein